MTQEFHPFPERTKAVLQAAHEKKMAALPADQGGTKQSAYKAAMEAKRQRFQAGQAPQPGAAPTAPAGTPMMYEAGTAPVAQPSAQGVDKAKPLGPQLMEAIRTNGLQSNMFTQGIQPSNADAETMKKVSAPPAVVRPRADAAGISIDLPSNFAHYPFKDFYVERMKGEHLAKFIKANEDESYQPVVEAIAALSNSTESTGMYAVDSKGQQHEIPPAYLLTPQDFLYVLYHLRLNNFTRSKFSHHAVCQNEGHVKAVEEGRATPESLHIETFVEKSQLSMTKLERIPDPANYPLQVEDVYLKPPMMIDVLEVIDASNGIDAGDAALMDMATHIQHQTHYLTVEQRIEILRGMDIDDIETIQAYMGALEENYGVNETVLITCKECGASRKDEMSLDVHSFLPSRK